MGRAIAVRTDFSAGEVRRLAKRAKDAAQARRLLAIAAVLDGALREDAAKMGGMERQTLRDWDPFTGRATQAGQEAPGLSGPARGGGSDPSGPRRGALAGVRSHHAVVRGVWALDFGRHHLPRLEELGFLACERAAESLPAGS